MKYLNDNEAKVILEALEIGEGYLPCWLDSSRDTFAAAIRLMEAGEVQSSGNSGELPPLPEPYGNGEVCHTAKQMQAYARAAVAAERDQCALIADSVNNHDNPMTQRDVADAIRARK